MNQDIETLAREYATKMSWPEFTIGYENLKDGFIAGYKACLEHVYKTPFDPKQDLETVMAEVDNSESCGDDFS